MTAEHREKKSSRAPKSEILPRTLNEVLSEPEKEVEAIVAKGRLLLRRQNSHRRNLLHILLGALVIVLVSLFMAIIRETISPNDTSVAGIAVQGLEDGIPVRANPGGPKTVTEDMYALSQDYAGWRDDFRLLSHEFVAGAIQAMREDHAKSTAKAGATPEEPRAPKQPPTASRDDPGGAKSTPKAPSASSIVPAEPASAQGSRVAAPAVTEADMETRPIATRSTARLSSRGEPQARSPVAKENGQNADTSRLGLAIRGKDIAAMTVQGIVLVTIIAVLVLRRPSVGAMNASQLNRLGKGIRDLKLQVISAGRTMQAMVKGTSLRHLAPVDIPRVLHECVEMSEMLTDRARIAIANYELGLRELAGAAEQIRTLSENIKDLHLTVERRAVGYAFAIVTIIVTFVTLIDTSSGYRPSNTLGYCGLAVVSCACCVASFGLLGRLTTDDVQFAADVKEIATCVDVVRSIVLPEHAKKPSE